MVVGDFDFVGIPVLPQEADSILLVHADAVLAVPIAGQAFEAIAGWYGELAEITNAVQLGQLASHDWPDHRRASRSRAATVDPIE